MRNVFSRCILLIVLLIFSVPVFAQIGYPDKLKVFIDCNNARCDMRFIRTEINLVDFMLDRQAADVHVLVTEQNTGGGGDQYQLIFFGQHAFNNIKDTIRFVNDPNATEFEERDMLIQYLKLGLTPFVSKTKMAKNISLQMKTDNAAIAGNTDSTTTKDPWNYWVFNTGLNGNADADAVYKSTRLSGRFSVNRVTDALKTGFGINAGKNQTTFTLVDSNNVEEKIKITNNDYRLNQYLVKSLGDHWSVGYETLLSRNTFSNNKNRLQLSAGVEYAIFPYKEVNTRFFTVSYSVDVRRNNYFDSTLYDKKKETLWGHELSSTFRLNQKWGTISFGAEYHNYLHNWNFFNLEINTEVDIRITGGLSFNIFTSGELTRDQLFLPKAGATPQEVLTRRRQLASGYRFFTFFGINYRFGSKLNNFVNPRFD